MMLFIMFTLTLKCEMYRVMFFDVVVGLFLSVQVNVCEIFISLLWVFYQFALNHLWLIDRFYCLIDWLTGCSAFVRVLLLFRVLTVLVNRDLNQSVYEEFMMSHEVHLSESNYKQTLRVHITITTSVTTGVNLKSVCVCV